MVAFPSDFPKVEGTMTRWALYNIILQISYVVSTDMQRLYRLFTCEILSDF